MKFPDTKAKILSEVSFSWPGGGEFVVPLKRTKTKQNKQTNKFAGVAPRGVGWGV